MVPPRTSDELKAAVDSMFRIRAVESPPDATGQRSIWHRGSKGADLLSEVSAQGALVHQEFVLFGDMLVWDQAAGVRSGEAQSLVLGSGIKPSDTVHWDEGAALQVERLKRMMVALRDYSGDDRYILHLRKLVLSGGGDPAAWEPGDAEEITLGGAISRDQLMTPPVSPAQPKPAPAPTEASHGATIALVVGALLVLAALVLLFVK